jgi:hypothetical protein
MEQKFTKIENNKIKWEYFKKDTDFEDKEFGKLGVKGGYDYIIFDSKEQALSVLDRDISEVEKNLNHYQSIMDKNKHNLDTFKDLKSLVDSIGKLHNDFKEVNSDKIYSLYNNDPKKYQKLLSEFNKSKDYIKDELDVINKEYGRFLEYTSAKDSYDFNKTQLDKIQEQRTNLTNL